MRRIVVDNTCVRICHSHDVDGSVVGPLQSSFVTIRVTITALFGNTMRQQSAIFYFEHKQIAHDDVLSV